MVQDAFRSAWSDHGPAGLIGGVIGLFVGVAIARTLPLNCHTVPFTNQQNCDGASTLVLFLMASGGVLFFAWLFGETWSSYVKRRNARNAPPS
jgi:hypothetical protein